MKQRLYNLSYGRTPPAQWDVDGAFGEQDDQGNPRPAHEYQDALRAFQVGHGIPTSELGTEGPQTKQKLRTILRRAQRRQLELERGRGLRRLGELIRQRARGARSRGPAAFDARRILAHMKVRNVVAAAFATLAASCRSSSYIALPDVSRDHVAFSPDGTTLLVAGSVLRAYDLPSKRVLWEQPDSGPELVGFSFSPSGTFVAVVRKVARGPEANGDVRRVSDGTKVHRPLRPIPSPPTAPDIAATDTAEILAVSDEGTVVANGVAQLEVESLETGNVVYADPLRRATEVVVWERARQRFAFGTTGTPVVKVIEQVGSDWRAVATLEGAFRPAWTTAGLGFASDAGLELWDGHARRVVVKRSELDGLDRAASTWRFSSDGVYVAYWSMQSLRVFRVTDGARLVTHKEGGSSARPFWLVTFSGPVVHAFLDTGEVIGFDVRSPDAVTRRSFGSPGSSSRNLFVPGAGYDENYAPRLSQDGRYLDVFRAGRGHEVYVTE